MVLRVRAHNSLAQGAHAIARGGYRTRYLARHLRWLSESSSHPVLWCAYRSAGG